MAETESLTSVFLDGSKNNKQIKHHQRERRDRGIGMISNPKPRKQRTKHHDGEPTSREKEKRPGKEVTENQSQARGYLQRSRQNTKSRQSPALELSYHLFREKTCQAVPPKARSRDGLGKIDIYSRHCFL